MPKSLDTLMLSRQEHHQIGDPLLDNVFLLEESEFMEEQAIEHGGHIQCMQAYMAQATKPIAKIGKHLGYEVETYL